MNNKTVKIFLTFSPTILIEIFKKKFLKNNSNLKRFYGLYIITDKNENPINNNLGDVMDYASISYYIIRLAYRFKRTKINEPEIPGNIMAIIINIPHKKR